MTEIVAGVFCSW